MDSAIGPNTDSAVMKRSRQPPHHPLDTVVDVCPTSLAQTGFSCSTRCVNLVSPPNASKSASSASRLPVSTNVLRFGIVRPSVGANAATRFRASRSVRSRGERGKLVRCEMSLSVRSIASWSFFDFTVSARPSSEVTERKTHLCDTQVLDCGDLMACRNPPVWEDRRL